MYVVVLIEPAHPDEGLTVAEQVNQVIGPFSSEDDADNWIASFEEHASIYQYIITKVDDPPRR